MVTTVMDLDFQRAVPREWKSVGLRGLIALVFGLVVLLFPAFWTPILAIIFAAFVFADGVVAFMTGWRMYRIGTPWWPYMIIGVTGILFGVLAILSLPLAILATVYVVAFWAIVSGVFQIVAAIRLRDVIDTETLMIITGILSIVFGILLVLAPGLYGGLILTIMVGFFAVFYGTMMLFLAFRLRSMSDAV